MTASALSALEALRQRFLVRAQGDLIAVQRTFDGRGEDEPAFRARIHQLAGAAGTFGFGSVSEAAIVIDDQLIAGAQASAEDLRRLIDALETIVPSSSDSDFTELGS